MSKCKLTIVICTYNRNPILAECLSSITSQPSFTKGKVRVLVVNNMNEDHTHKEIEEMIKPYSAIQLIRENRAGLSFARNAAISTCSTPWIGFVDDDAKVGPEFLNTALTCISSGEYDCFGGHIQSWFKHEKPRWMSEDFGSKPILSTTSTALSSDFVWGSNIFFRMSALVEVGGFPTSIGMKQDKLGYGAENIVQMRLRERGFIVGYIPTLSISHLVLPVKYNLIWHIRSAYATGRDGINIFPEQYTFQALVGDLRKLIGITVRSSVQLFKSKSYFWENAVLDIGKSAALLLGKILK